MRIRIRKSLLMVPALPVTLIYLYIHADVTPSSTFKNYNEMAPTPDFFDGGRIPRWIPKTAYDIDFSVNIDTNEKWLAFFFSPTDNFYAECLRLDKDALNLYSIRWTDSFRASLFPSFVRDLVTAVQQEGIEFYRCDGSKRSILAIDRKLSQGYIWKYEEWDDLEHSHFYSTVMLV